MKKIKQLNWIMIIGISIFSILYLFFGNHSHSLYKNLIIISIIPVMLIPTLINKIFKINLNPEIELVYLIFIFFGYFLGSILNFYYKIPIYDKIIHGLSGVITSILAIIILVKSRCYDKNPIWVNVLFIICVTLSVAAFWEFFEFIGSIIYSLIYIIEKKTKKKILVEKFVQSIK